MRTVFQISLLEYFLKRHHPRSVNGVPNISLRIFSQEAPLKICERRSKYITRRLCWWSVASIRHSLSKLFS